MSEPNGGQEPQNGTPQEGAPAQTPAPAQAPAQTAAAAPAQTPTFTPEYVSELRGEAASYRKKASDLETKFKEADTERTALKGRVETMALKFAIGSAPTKVADVDVAFSLIDKSKITFDEKGEPTNVDDLLKELVTAKPFLAGAFVPSPTNPTNPARDGAKYTLEQIKQMSQDEINENWDDVQRALSGK
jgi:hypothetical protein